MANPPITLKSADDLLPQVESVLGKLFKRIAALVPGAELHHIGATAIPGSMTKGDIDILFRVPRSQFESVKELMGRNFEIKQRVNWTEDFASFGDDETYAIPVGVQLVAADSESDFLLYLRDYMIANPEAAKEYNRIKAAHAAEGRDGYWKAKNTFLQELLAVWTKGRSSSSKPSPGSAGAQGAPPKT